MNMNKKSDNKEDDNGDNGDDENNEDEYEYSINPDKEEEIINEFADLLYKKKKTKEERVKLYVLSALLFQEKPKNVRKLVKWCTRRVSDKNKKTTEEIEKEIEKLWDRVIFISKKEEGKE